MLPWLPALLACGAVDPDPPDDRRWHELALGERAIGVGWSAEGLVGGQRVLWRGERYRWLLDGAEHPVDAWTRAAVDADGRAVRLRSWRNGERVADYAGEPVWWLDAAAWDGSLVAGELDAVDPLDGTVRSVEVEADEGGWSWTRDGVTTTVVHSEVGVVQHWGALSRRAVAHVPELPIVDPVALVRRPSVAVPDARSRRWARWWVDGRERIVEVPLDLEIPRRQLQELRELVDEVRSSLVHAPTPGTPSARRALATGVGDCNEHAEVFRTLAEARGWRVRPVSGLVYTEESGGPALDLHAWVEVEVPVRGWIPVDPALGQAIADATHLRLAEGPDLARSVLLLTSDAPIELVEVR